MSLLAFDYPFKEISNEPLIMSIGLLVLAQLCCHVTSPPPYYHPLLSPPSNHSHFAVDPSAS